MIVSGRFALIITALVDGNDQWMSEDESLIVVGYSGKN